MMQIRQFQSHLFLYVLIILGCAVMNVLVGMFNITTIFYPNDQFELLWQFKQHRRTTDVERQEYESLFVEQKDAVESTTNRSNPLKYTGTTVAEKNTPDTTYKQPIIDIITVGSHSRWDLVQIQNATFATHPSVRNFYAFNEDDDSDIYCYTNLTMQSTLFVSKFCVRNKYREKLKKFRQKYARVKWLQKKENPMGWLCAQKRPAESLYKVLDKYRRQQHPPDYLFLLDDDTYLNMVEILERLPESYPPQNSYAIAGCMIREHVDQHNFTFPWGGFGTIFTKSSIEKFLYPLQCQQSEQKRFGYETLSTTARELTLEEFEFLACRSILEDKVGEAFLYEPGMSVADLMHAYVTHWQYVNAEKNWPAFGMGAGFCFHADWVLGYFINSYYLARHTTGKDALQYNHDDRLHSWEGSYVYATTGSSKNSIFNQCKFDGDTKCQHHAHFCHHTTPEKMKELHGFHSHHNQWKQLQLAMQ